MSSCRSLSSQFFRPPSWELTMSLIFLETASGAVAESTTQLFRSCRSSCRSTVAQRQESCRLFVQRRAGPWRRSRAGPRFAAPQRRSRVGRSASVQVVMQVRGGAAAESSRSSSIVKVIVKVCGSAAAAARSSLWQSLSGAGRSAFGAGAGHCAGRFPGSRSGAAAMVSVGALRGGIGQADAARLIALSAHRVEQQRRARARSCC